MALSNICMLTTPAFISPDWASFLSYALISHCPLTISTWMLMGIPNLTCSKPNCSCHRLHQLRKMATPVLASWPKLIALSWLFCFSLSHILFINKSCQLYFPNPPVTAFFFLVTSNTASIISPQVIAIAFYFCPHPRTAHSHSSQCEPFTIWFESRIFSTEKLQCLPLYFE